MEDKKTCFEKKFEDDEKGIFTVSTITNSYDSFKNKVKNNIPGVLIPNIKEIGRSFINLQRDFLPYNLQSYLKLNLLDIEGEWIAYQLLLTLEQIHSHKLLHLNIKRSNVLVNCMGMVFLCDMGFHLESLKYIEKKNFLYFKNYFKMNTEEVEEYIDPKRKVEKITSSMINDSSTSSTYGNERVLTSFDTYPLLKILENDMKISSYILCCLKEKIKKFDENNTNWEISKHLKDCIKENLFINFKFFEDLNKEIVNSSKDFYSIVIQYFFVNWEEIWKKVIINYKDNIVPSLITKIKTNFNKKSFEKEKTSTYIYILLINYLLPSIFYCDNPSYKTVGLEMLEKLIFEFIERNKQEDKCLIYIFERISPILINIFTDTNNNNFVKYDSLELFFKYIKQINFSKINFYEDFQIIYYLINKFNSLFTSDSNESLISIILDKIEILINFFNQFSIICIKTILEKYLERKDRNELSNTSFMGKEIKDIEKSLRCYDDHLKERIIEFYLQFLIEKVISMKNENLNIKLLRNLPKFSLYLKKENYMFLIKSIFDKKNDLIVIEIIKILDNIILFNENGDVIDMILTNLKTYFNQIKILELIKMIIFLYEEGFFEEFPLIEEKLIFGPDNIFNFLSIAKGCSLKHYEKLISFLISIDLPKFFTKIQKNIIPFFSKQKDKFLFSDKDLSTNNTHSRRNSEYIFSRETSININSIIVKTFLDITNITFSFYDFLDHNIIELYIYKTSLYVFREKNNISHITKINVFKDPIFKYNCQVVENYALQEISPCLNKNLIYFEDGIIYFIDKNSNKVLGLNVENKEKIEYFEQNKENILFLIKVFNQDSLIIITNTEILKYSLSGNEIFNYHLKRMNGKIMCYDYTFDKRKIIFGTNLSFLYIYDICDNQIKVIQLTNLFIPIINIKSTTKEGLFYSVLVQFKTKILNCIEHYILQETPALINKFSIKKSHNNEELSFDIQTICSEFDKNKVFFSGGKDLIYWDYNKIENKETSRNISNTTSEKLYGSIKHLQGFCCSTISVPESLKNNHSFIKKIISYRDEDSYIIFTLHTDGIISLWT